MLIHKGLITNVLGMLLIFNSGFMLIGLPVSMYYKESVIHILFSFLITFISGLILVLATRDAAKQELCKRDGYLIVSIGWLVMIISGTLPYLLSGSISSFTDAFFETASGYTTTGATILDEIEGQPKNILMWRSLTQWIGGMGIIVLAVAILPFLGIGGMQLFSAESPGVEVEKLRPHIRGTASRLWVIYLGMTVAEATILTVGGMNFYDAINHSLTTISSGGFSIKQSGIAHYNSPFLEYVITLFMLFAGMNFTMTYFLLKGKFQKLKCNDELRNYLLATVLFTITAFIALKSISSAGIETIFRQVLFQVVSIVTTTGFTTVDYTSWSPFLTYLFFFMMFLGASTGSTAGGIKIFRHTILIKNSSLVLKRLLHPAAVIPVRINNQSVDPNITSQVHAFIMGYLMLFGIGTLVLMALNVDSETALGSVATSLGNVGPGIGYSGPSYTFSGLPEAGKWVLSAYMLLGRLELYTVLVLFSKFFWRYG